MSQELRIERLFGGRPILSPQGDGWESGVTFNSAAVLLENTPENRPLILGLLGAGQQPRDIVVLHYRARPAKDPGFENTRSYIGLSIHEPDLTLISRRETPVIFPGRSGEPDYLGAEDPRISKVDGKFWAIYCGVAEDPRPEHHWIGYVCAASSDDLVDWKKTGVLQGFSGSKSNPHSNKDAVLFPERIDGKVAMLHRPMVGDQDTWQTTLAFAEKPEGPYINQGPIHGAIKKPEFDKTWCGAGATPIKIGEGRYVSIEHTGAYYPDKSRRYVLDAFLYDFNNWDPTDPSTVMKARLDELMIPETDFEINGPFEESVGNVLFSCGAYVYDGWLYIVYGGGDSYILGARLRFDELVAELEKRAEKVARERMSLGVF